MDAQVKFLIKKDISWKQWILVVEPINRGTIPLGLTWLNH